MLPLIIMLTNSANYVHHHYGGSFLNDLQEVHLGNVFAKRRDFRPLHEFSIILLSLTELAELDPRKYPPLAESETGKGIHPSGMLQLRTFGKPQPKFYLLLTPSKR